jgi:putative addiction module component (TIGR02574 family)
MNASSLSEILELPVQDRIRVVELIWENIAAVPDALAVSPELKAELELELSKFEANPDDGFSWEEVKAQARSGMWRTA